MPDLDYRSAYQPPRARGSDPWTSDAAIEELIKSGGHKRQLDTVLHAVKRHTTFNAPLTARELAKRAGIDRYVLSRRLPDLKEAGLVVRDAKRRCAECGRACTTWRLRQEEPTQRKLY